MTHETFKSREALRDGPVTAQINREFSLLCFGLSNEY